MKRLITIITAFMMLLNTLMPSVVSAHDLITSAEDKGSFISVENGIVEYKINTKNGRFTVSTKDGIPDKASDNDKNLLFFDKTPDTSFTTFRINGKDYIFGNKYANGGIISGPTLEGKIITTEWKIDEVYVVQTIQLLIDESNPNAGNAKITYTLVNRGADAVTADARILLDTQLGSNDASPMVIGSTYITNETELTGDYVPDVWKSADERYAPNVISYGLNGGWDNIEPSKMIVAHWENISSTKWDYKPNEYINFTSDKNEFGGADSAVALYYEGHTLTPGTELVYETFYGIGSIADASVDANFTLQVNMPSKLTVNEAGTGYNEQVFDVIVSIDNTSLNSKTLENVDVFITTDPELSTPDGEVTHHKIKTIAAGDKIDVVFKLTAAVQNELKVAEMGITVIYDAEGNYTEARKFVILPSVKGNPPSMQMTEISPTTLYTKGLKKSLLIVGSGFEALKADYEWSMYLVSNITGEEYLIKRKDITISNDNLNVNIDKDYVFNEGEHQIQIRSASFGNMSKIVQFSNDERYDMKTYGVLVIGGFEKNDKGKTIYSARPYRSETAIPKDVKDNTYIFIKGDIFERKLENETVQYECAEGSIINNFILYTPPNEEPNKCIKVKRYNNKEKEFWGDIENSLAMSGSGFLRIGDYSFHGGDFYVTLEDGKDYELTDAVNPDYEYGGEKEEDDDKNVGVPGEKEEEPNKVIINTPETVTLNQILKTVGIFAGTNIQIGEIILGKDTVSLSGKVSVGLPWMSKAAKDDGDDDDDDKDKKDGSKAGDAKGGKPIIPGATEEKKDKLEKIDKGVGEGKRTDDIATVELKEMRYGLQDDNKSYLVGFNAHGEINLTDDSIPKLKKAGGSAKLDLNYLDERGLFVGIGAGVKVGDAFEAEAEVTLVLDKYGDCYPDTIELVVGGDAVKVPLGTIGYLTKFGGGAYNIYDSFNDNWAVLPPFTMKLITGYEDPTSVALELDTLSMEIGCMGITFEGEEGKVVGLKVLESAYGKVNVYMLDIDNKIYPSIDLSVGSRINVLNIVKGGVDVWLVYDPRLNTLFGPVSLGGKGFIGLVVPEHIPFVGGQELFGVSAELSSVRLFAGVNLIGIPFSIGYYWTDKQLKFNDDVSLSSAFNIPVTEVTDSLGYIVAHPEEDETGVMIFGSNMSKTYSSLDKASLYGTTSSSRHEIPVKDQDYALFEVQYSDNSPNLKVTKPDGTNYPLVENENYLVQVIDEDVSLSGTKEQRAYISVIDPMDGTWVIESDTPVDCIANDVKALPEIKNLDCELKNNSEVSVEWDAQAIDDDYKVDLYISEAGEEYNIADFAGREEEYYDLMAENYDSGIVHVKDIPAKDGKATFKINDRIMNGEYKVRAVLHKNGETFDSELSENTFKYKNPNVPATPANVKVTPGGNGKYRVEYDEVVGADKYIITVLNEDGTEIDDYDYLMTDETVAYIGGTVSVATGYDENNEPTGFKEVGTYPGNSYRVKVCAYKEKDSLTYTSDAYISDPILIPVPKPITPTIKVNGRTAIFESTDHNENVYTALTNKRDSIVEFSADMDVVMSYTIDKSSGTTYYELAKGEVLTIPVELLEGGSMMEFYTVNDQNDYKLTRLSITLDNTPPVLMINEATVFSENGKYSITGTVETDSSVYVGSSLTPIEIKDGYFTYTGTQTGSRDTVSFTAIDKAGNETVIQAYAIDKGITAFKDVIIKDASGNTIEKLNMYRDDTAEIAAYGVDSAGNEYKLDNTNVEYSVLYGSDKVRINENGIITADYYGDAVVVCKYKVSDSYTFESTLEVIVEQKHEGAKDIRLSATEVYLSTTGNIVGRLSVPDAAIGMSYSYSIADNEYFTIDDNMLTIKKNFTAASYDVKITAQGYHMVNNTMAKVGEPYTKTFTITRVKRIASVEPIDGLKVFVDKPFEKLNLPSSVVVTYTDGQEESLPVTWNLGAYNPDVPNLYTVKGHLELASNIINPDNIKAEVNVLVNKAISDLNIDSIHEVTYGDNIVFTALVSKNPESVVLAAETDPDKVLFYNNDTGELLGTADVVYDEGNVSGKAIFTYNTADRKLKMGINNIKAHYNGGVKLNGSDSNIDVVKLVSKEITVDITDGEGVEGGVIVPVKAEPVGYVDGYKPELIITYTGLAYGGKNINTTQIPPAGNYTATVSTPDKYYKLTGNLKTKFIVEKEGNATFDLSTAITDITPAGTEGERLYELKLVADKGIINRLNSADLTFKLTQTKSFGKNSYEIIDIEDDYITVNAVGGSKDRYEFHFDKKGATVNDTATSIAIARVKVTGYGEFKFEIDKSAHTNQAHATTASNNIVDTYIPDGKVQGKSDFHLDANVTENIPVPTRKLTVNIDFPNPVENNVKAYQQMQFKIYGGDLKKEIVLDLATDAVIPDITSEFKPDAKITLKDQYTVELTDALTANTAYTVEVSGAGYRTARYTVNMQSDYEGNVVKFWNNVKDNAIEVEEGKAISKTDVTFLAGDVINDGKINIYDLSAIVSYFGEIDLKESGKNGYAKYDLNRDGKINSKDVAYVLVSWGK